MTGQLERISWGDAAPDAGERLRVAETLERGGLVALPTETVYGLAARADLPAAVDGLRALKGRQAAQALTWHVGSREALGRFPRPSAMARRLAERYWPGPLTLVLEGIPEGLEVAATGGWTGLRYPAHDGTASLLAELPFPVVATSANRTGEPAIDDPDEIARVFSEELDLVVDGGTPRLGEGSVVLRVGPGSFDLLRPGILDLEQLRATAGLRIAFVCTGNTCRSPLAEGLARKLTAERLEVLPEQLRDFGFAFESMGLMASPGSRASEHTLEVLARRDIDISEHRSQSVQPDELPSFDRVYAMTSGHLESLRLLLPPGADEHCELVDPEGKDLPDPIGGPLSDYERTAEHLERAINARLEEWL